MKTCLIGIINNIPSSPPVKAITVVRYISNDCQTPININAGIVKIIPAARDSPAEQLSEFDCFKIEFEVPLILEKYFKANIPSNSCRDRS